MRVTPQYQPAPRVPQPLEHLQHYSAFAPDQINFGNFDSSPHPEMMSTEAGGESPSPGLWEPDPEKATAPQVPSSPAAAQDKLPDIPFDDVPPAGASPALHHLTRHWLAPAARGGAALVRLGAADRKSAEQMIRNMGQRELRASFQRVYGSATNSFNNSWLRRKLYEAVGDSGGNGNARKTKRIQAIQHRRLAAEAAALEALAEIAAGVPTEPL